MAIHFEKFTVKARDAIQRAQSLAAELDQQMLEPMHLLGSLLDEKDGIVRPLLEKLGVNVLQLADITRTEMDLFPKVTGVGGGEQISGELKAVLEDAQQRAVTMRDDYTSTEHLLLGIARERQALAAKALVNLGVDLETVRTQMEAMVGRRGSLYTGGGGLTRRCQRVIEYSARLARGSGRRTVGTGHLLHSLMTDPEDAAGQLLEGMGVNANRVEEELQRLGYDLEEALASPTGR